jgi:hypothetical protein
VTAVRTSSFGGVDCHRLPCNQILAKGRILSAIARAKIGVHCTSGQLFIERPDKAQL